MVEIIRTDHTDLNFMSLISKLDCELRDNYGDLQNDYDKYNRVEVCNTVIVAMQENNTIGCGCFKKFDNVTAEIKRMFVHKDHRGKGISKKILNELENWARECGFEYTLLETGNKQKEAVGLYKSFGYEVIENYGQYAGVGTSICMKKNIKL